MGWCFGPNPDAAPADVRAKRIQWLASLADVVPAAVDADIPVQVGAFGGRVVMRGPVAASEYVQLLQALREPVGAAFTTVVAGERAPAAPPTTRGGQDAGAKLEQILPEVRLDGVGLEAALDQLRETARANIVVDWHDLEAAGIDRTTPVKLHVWDLPLSRTLTVVLAAAGGDTVTLDFRAEGGVIRVATADRLAATGTLLRIYDVRPLVVRHAAANAELDAVYYAEVMSRNPTTAPVEAGGYLKTQEEVIEEITTLLRETVDPDSWRDNGGTLGALREWAGRLFITQTPENHRKTEEILTMLYDASAAGGLDAAGTTRPTTSPCRPCPDGCGRRARAKACSEAADMGGGSASERSAGDGCDPAGLRSPPAPPSPPPAAGPARPARGSPSAAPRRAR